MYNLSQTLIFFFFFSSVFLDESLLMQTLDILHLFLFSMFCLMTYTIWMWTLKVIVFHLKIMGANSSSYCIANIVWRLLCNFFSTSVGRFLLVALISPPQMNVICSFVTGSICSSYCVANTVKVSIDPNRFVPFGMCFISFSRLQSEDFLTSYRCSYHPRWKLCVYCLEPRSWN